MESARWMTSRGKIVSDEFFRLLTVDHSTTSGRAVLDSQPVTSDSGAMSQLDQYMDMVEPYLRLLQSLVPPQIYSLITSSFSYGLQLLNTLFNIIAATSPLSAPYTITPALLTILCVYLALSSLYRTVMFAFWFVKWGIILGALFSLAGWMNSGAPAQILANLVPAAMDNKSGSSRPKSWESWSTHDRYKREQKTQRQKDSEEAQKFIQNVIDTAGDVYQKSGNWWETAKGVYEEINKQGQTKQSGKRTSSTKSR